MFYHRNKKVKLEKKHLPPLPLSENQDVSSVVNSFPVCLSFGSTSSTGITELWWWTGDDAGPNGHILKLTIQRRLHNEQKCIPVGCVPPAAVVIAGGGVWSWSTWISPLDVGLDLIPLNFPLGCGSESDSPEFPPWVWAWIWSHSISPLGVGLDLIPLNFSLGYGPGSDPLQFPPWVCAWTWSISISPLGVGLELILLNFPLRCGPGGGSPWQGGVSLAGGRGSPWQRGSLVWGSPWQRDLPDRGSTRGSLGVSLAGGSPEGLPGRRSPWQGGLSGRGSP